MAELKLRMSEELRAQIEDAAESTGNSMNREMNNRLEQSFKQNESDDLEARISALESRFEPRVWKVFRRGI